MDHESILDGDSFSKKDNRVSTQMLLEIAECRLNYPKYFVDIAKDELKKRPIENKIIVNKTFDETPKVSFVKWVKKNPFLSVLTLIISISFDFIGFGIVWASLYSSIQLNPDYRSKIWRTVNWVAIVLFISCILVGILIKFK